MAVCQVCNKSKQYGHNVSHSKRRTKRVFKPNVFRKRMLLSLRESRIKNQKSRTNGDIQRIKICSKCLKRAKKFWGIKAAKGAELSGNVIRHVEWQKLAQEQLKTGDLQRKEKEIDQKEVREKKAEKEEVSVEELIGKKK